MTGFTDGMKTSLTPEWTTPRSSAAGDCKGGIMSDCANGGAGRWADAQWHAPMEMPAARYDGSDLLTIQTLCSSIVLKSASRVLLVDDANERGYLFVAAKRRDWDDVEVD